jgi:hypothetical protein
MFVILLQNVLLGIAMVIGNSPSEEESSASEEDKLPTPLRKKKRQLHKESGGKII